VIKKKAMTQRRWTQFNFHPKLRIHFS
jgi:hypothetical protein